MHIGHKLHVWLSLVLSWPAHGAIRDEKVRMYLGDRGGGIRAPFAAVSLSHLLPRLVASTGKAAVRAQGWCCR